MTDAQIKTFLDGFTITKDGDAKRKTLAHYVNIGTEAAPEWELLGYKVEDSSIEYNWEIETVRSIRELLKLFHRLLFTCADDEAAQLTSRTELQTLTPREMEIVNLLEQGITPANIAHILHITVPTTNRHIYNIYKKVNVNSRAELMAKIK